jgi:putative DNA primase/helicase
VAAFVREKCVVGLNRRIKKAELFNTWKIYCNEQGEKPGSHRVFGRNLLAAFPQVRAGHSGDTKYYAGINLADDDDGEPNVDEGRGPVSSRPAPSDDASNAGTGDDNADRSGRIPEQELSDIRNKLEALRQRRMRENATKIDTGEDEGNGQGP